MQTVGVELLLDLFNCQSPALNNEAVLEQLFLDTLEFAGFETVDHLSHRFSTQVTTIICILRQSHAALHAWPETGLVTGDVYACGKPDAVRPALEIVRGYLAQKLIARSVNSRFIERGLDANATGAVR